MTLAIEPIVGSTRVVVLTPHANVVRGTAAEYRHFGVSIVLRGETLAALTEIVHDPTATLVVSADIPCDELRDVLDLAVATCGASVLLGLTATTDAAAVRAALGAGIRATVDLPLSPERLARSLRARPSTLPETGPITIGALTVDPRRYGVDWAGDPVGVTPREFGILHALARCYPEVATLDELARSYYGSASDPYAAVRVVINHVRARLERAGGSGAADVIETIRGIGYRLIG